MLFVAWVECVKRIHLKWVWWRRLQHLIWGCTWTNRLVCMKTLPVCYRTWKCPYQDPFTEQVQVNSLKNQNGTIRYPDETMTGFVSVTAAAGRRQLMAVKGRGAKSAVSCHVHRHRFHLGAYWWDHYPAYIFCIVPTKQKLKLNYALSLEGHLSPPPPTHTCTS